MVAVEVTVCLRLHHRVGSSLPVTGYVDLRGEHAFFEFDDPTIGNFPVHCTLDLAHVRAVRSSEIQDELVPGAATLTCGEGPPVQITGYKE